MKNPSKVVVLRVSNLLSSCFFEFSKGAELFTGVQLVVEGVAQESWARGGGGVYGKCEKGGKWDFNLLLLTSETWETFRNIV